MWHGTTSRLLVLLGALVATPPVGYVASTGAPAPSAASTESAPAPARTGDAAPTRSPDRIAAYSGGIAARLRADGGAPLPGDVYLLMAVRNADTMATAYVETPFVHDRGEHDDTRGSNIAARDFVERVTGERVELLELTSAPGGGESGGVAYALGYLDVVHEGGFTGGLRVAATGKVGADGYVQPISAIDAKTAAAALAGSQVVFVASIPDDETVAAHADRFVGTMRWTPNPDSTLAEQRGWDRYHEWGAERPAGMDVVAVRHLGDVAAYLCGAGSDTACEVAATLTRRSEETSSQKSALRT